MVNASIAVGEGAFCGDCFGGWRVAEDEELYENTDEDYNGDLPKKETLGEGESILNTGEQLDMELSSQTHPDCAGAGALPAPPLAI